MAEPVLTVNRVPVTDSMRSHPLATRSGIAMMAHLLQAIDLWTRCTKPQKLLLAELCPPVVEVMLAKDALTADELPLLPGRVTAASRAAMRKRGLVDDDGRLTATAVHAWFYAGQPKERPGGDAA